MQVYVTLYSYFTDNYVTPFWEKYAYLYSREPLLISSSVAHVDLVEDRPANQAVRAAHVVYIEALSMLAFYNQTLKPLGDGIVSCTHYKNVRIQLEKTAKKFKITRLFGFLISDVCND